MQAQAQRFSKLVKPALTVAVLAAVLACPSPSTFEPENGGFSGEGPQFEAAPRPSGIPESDSAPPDVGTTSPDLGEGPIIESAPRPPVIPESDFRPPDAGIPLPEESYDCNRTGLHLAQVELANIKMFMDDAYLAFTQNERSGEYALAREKYDAYVRAKTDLDLKRWRCFNCPGEIGCN